MIKHYHNRYEKYKQILVSYENYRKLKDLGSAGDSFNDVITDMLKRINGLQQPSGFVPR